MTGEYRVPRWALASFLAALTGIFYFNLVSLQRTTLMTKRAFGTTIFGQFNGFRPMRLRASSWPHTTLALSAI